MAEGLGRSISAAITDGSLKGLPLHNLQPALSHSQFVDDTLLLNSPSAKEALSLNSILSDFTEASGMSLNLDKSKLYFFNTPAPVQIHISRLLGIPRSSLPSNYLGVPLTGAAARSISWESLLLSISNRLSNWTFRPLNIASRLVLLKSVLQALPTYLFTVLAAPKHVIKAIRTLQRNFLWHGHQPNKKWALVGWDKICMPKSQGGLGLRDPGKLNQVMGAKIWWRWLKAPATAWASIWRHKYAPLTPDNQLIRHNTRIQGSNIWNIAWQNRTLIQNHAFWEVRDGESALLWQDSWQQFKPLNECEDLNTLQEAIDPQASLKVKDLWKPQGQHWHWRQWKLTHQDLGVTENLNLDSWHTQAKRRQIPVREGADILRWGYSTAGTFTIKEAYNIHSRHQANDKEAIWNKVWNSALWPKVSTFLWLVVHNRTLTWDNLRKRGFIGPSLCVLCHQQEETKEHLFNGCSYSQRVWDQSAQIMRKSGQHRNSVNETIEHWDNISYKSTLLNHIWQLLPGFILWQLWKERNKRIFHSQVSPPEATWETISSRIKETIRSHPWKLEDLQSTPDEQHILQHWQPLPSIHQVRRITKPPQASPTTWSPPHITSSKSTLMVQPKAIREQQDGAQWPETRKESSWDCSQASWGKRQTMWRN
jgi:hypothetical protein